MTTEIPTERSAMGFEQITVAGTAIGFTQAKYRSAPGINARAGYIAVVTVEGAPETNDIRWTVDGTTPTAAIGHLLPAGDTLIVKGTGNLEKFRMIRVDSSATVSVSYF